MDFDTVRKIKLMYSFQCGCILGVGMGVFGGASAAMAICACPPCVHPFKQCCFMIILSMLKLPNYKERFEIYIYYAY
jgi:hypothetical protein